MMMKSPERRTAESEERAKPGTSKGSLPKRKVELIKSRAPLRRTITLLHVKLRELINRGGSRTFLKKKMDELELTWEQCRKLDKLLLEIANDQEGDEALSKEEESQLDYEEKMEELREAAKEYLERRMMDPPSIAGSRAGSVVNLEEDAEERDREVEEVVREIQGQTKPEHRTQTKIWTTCTFKDSRSRAQWRQTDQQR